MSAPDLLAGLPALVAAAIGRVTPELRECAAHPGRFDLAEIEAFGAKAPAVRVAFLGLDRGQPAAGPARHRRARLAAFVVTRDTIAPDGAPLDRGEAAAAIVQRLVLLIQDNRWQVRACGPADAVEAENLYSSGARGRGVALWAVSWEQPVALEPVPDDALLPPALYVGFAPEIGPPHVDDYTLVAGAPPEALP